MKIALISILLLTSLVAVILLGQWLQRRLPDDHLSADSKDAVKLAIGLVATMTALLLGLLAFSAKGTYDTRRTEVIEMAAKVTLLDNMLTAYLDNMLTASGPDAAEARVWLREAVAEWARRAWSDEAGARAHMVAMSQANYRAYAAILGLSPRDDRQRDLKTRAATLAIDLAQLRMLLLEQRAPSIPKALLIGVFCWLVVIFLSFGLLTPTNVTTTLALSAAAVSVASAVFLIMELDQPLGGIIRIPGDPLSNALDLFTK
jgi:hypothetical protein